MSLRQGLPPKPSAGPSARPSRKAFRERYAYSVACVGTRQGGGGGEEKLRTASYVLVTGLSPPLVAMKLRRSTLVTTPVMTVTVL